MCSDIIPALIKAANILKLMSSREKISLLQRLNIDFKNLDVCSATKGTFYDLRERSEQLTISIMDGVESQIISEHLLAAVTIFRDILMSEDQNFDEAVLAR